MLHRYCWCEKLRSLCSVSADNAETSKETVDVFKVIMKFECFFMAIVLTPQTNPTAKRAESVLDLLVGDALNASRLLK